MPVQLQEQPTQEQIAAPVGTGQLPAPESDLPTAEQLAEAQAEHYKIALKGSADEATKASEKAFKQAEVVETVPKPVLESAKTDGSRNGGLLSMLGIKRSK